MLSRDVLLYQLGFILGGSSAPALNKEFPRRTQLKARDALRKSLVDAHGMAPLPYVLSSLSPMVEPASHRFIVFS